MLSLTISSTKDDGFLFPHIDPTAPRSCFENTDKLSHLVAGGAQTIMEVLEISISKFRGLFILHMIIGTKKTVYQI